MALPALPDTARLTSYTVSVASVGPYSVGFDIYADGSDYANWLEVWLDNVQQVGNWTLTSDTGTGLAALNRPITDAEITFASTITGALKIVGARRPRPVADLTEGQGLPARTLNYMINDVLAILRELYDLRSRIYMAAPGSAGGTGSIPTVGVSSFMATLLDDTSASAARATLGVSGTVAPSIPQGRLTLTSGTAITTADVTGATTVYYALAVGNYVPIYDGANFVSTVFTELSNLTTASSVGKAGPAAVANNSAYFLLVWSDSGTIRLTRSPAWSSVTSVGTGAGSAEIELLNGVLVNKVAITNGPGVRLGTVVGSIRSNGSAQLTDSKLFRWVSNIYNAVPRFMRAIDPTDSWAYTTATWRQANGTTANEINWHHALDGSPIEANVLGAVANSTANTYGIVSIGIDSTTTPVSGALNSLTYVQVVNQTVTPTSEYRGYAGQGSHRAVWLEQAQASGTATWDGDAGAALIQTGIQGWVLN